MGHARMQLAQLWFPHDKESLACKDLFKARICQGKGFPPHDCQKVHGAPGRAAWHHQCIRDGLTCPWPGYGGTLWQHLNQNPALRFPRPGEEKNHAQSGCAVTLTFAFKKEVGSMSVT